MQPSPVVQTSPLQTNDGLDAIFNPRSVAVVGATEREGSVGRTILWNLISNPFGGAVYPINPKRSNVLGIRSYPDLKSLPEVPDLAVFVTPAKTIPALIKDAVKLGIKGAIVISAGFKEIGPEGAALEQQILKYAREGDMRIIGPNCLGVMAPLTGVNATFAASMARPGNIAFISQSGALLTAVLDYSFKENIGFSSFVSLGSMLDVGWGDLIDYLGRDPRTSSIVIYMESVGDARKFLSAAREVALKKPILVIKAGRTAAAAKAAASHTGSLAGSDEVLDAAFRRCGVLRVNSIADVFYMADVLGKQPRPEGNRLSIITNAGGPGVLATDALITGGGALADISDETMAQLNELLPSAWSHNNPIDVLGDAAPETYAKAVEIAANDPHADGLLVILTPQAMTDPTQTAELLRPYGKLEGKPLIASWMGGSQTQAGDNILSGAGIPTFEFPDDAARAFNYMWRFSYNLRAIYETPSMADDTSALMPDREYVAKILNEARSQGRTILTEYESKEVLAAYHIPTVKTIVATSEDEAVQAAESLGYPVVIKLHSLTITHKTDVGGVQLNLRDADAVRNAYRTIYNSVAEKASADEFQGVAVQTMVNLRDAYELIIGSSIDTQFGPVLLFGTGGTMVEVFKDRALGLPPLTTTLARRMMEQTKIYTALKGVRGRDPVDIAELEEIMVRFSQLIVEQPWIKELDINPLLASSEQILALDARIVLYPNDTPEDKLPSPAIRPYPIQYVYHHTLRDGTKVTIRPIRPEDEPLMAAFNGTLSERSVYLRYLQVLNLNQRTQHDRLARLSFIDYDREMALVAEKANERTGQPEVVGVARMTKLRNRPIGEYGMIVSDRYQGQGIGKRLLGRMIDVAKAEQLEQIVGIVLPENAEMIRLLEKFGFEMHQNEGEPVLRSVLVCKPDGKKPAE
ncbi:MAG: bifunctional acetate--CoA ligase family protein/GNAT family N-acetyltransferase [Anaerolineae bacterium]|nr:bifunctional acetate--CoA ligase family protein/GNAT family N-acetyltransferase [Anaerolineae bacterium]